MATKKKKSSGTRKTANRAVATIHADVTIGEQDVKRAAKAIGKAGKRVISGTTKKIKRILK